MVGFERLVGLIMRKGAEDSGSLDRFWYIMDFCVSQYRLS